MSLLGAGIIGGALIGGGLRLASTIAGNQARKKEQRRIERREDMAVQRRADDLAAAGLSRTLAAGSAATTHGPAQLDNPDLGGFSPEQMIALRQGMADISQTEAQTHLNEVLAIEHDRMAQLKEQEYLHNVVKNPMMIRQMRADLAGTNLRNTAQSLENEINSEYGKDAARMRNNAMKLANEIVAVHGLDEAEARVIGLRLANERGQYDLGFYRERGLPTGSWGSLNALERAGRDIGFMEANPSSSTLKNTGGRANPLLLQFN